MGLKIFHVPDCGSYVYDGETNRIITLPPGMDFGKMEEESVRTRLIAEGLLTEGDTEETAWRENIQELRKRRESGLETLVLQLTRDCNLRCGYCVYSGSFRHMLPHAREDMAEDTICSAIDFFMSHNGNTEKPVIILYGGEPLLRFDLVRLAVSYAKKSGRRLRFGINTNGTLLSEEMAFWLRQNPEVSVTVTLNGPQHDQYRKTTSGRGSLQMILGRLHRIREKFPDVWENQIRFIANLVCLADAASLREFYIREIGKLPVRVTMVNMDHYVGDPGSISDTLAAQEDICRIEQEYVQGGDPFYGVIFEPAISHIHNRGIVPPGMPVMPNSCEPLSWRLFVRTDGTFNICERVCDRLSVGSVRTGYDEDRLEKLYYGMLGFLRSNCAGCWARRLCMVCYQDILDEDGTIAGRIDREKCELSRQRILRSLQMYVSLAVHHPERLERSSE